METKCICGRELEHGKSLCYICETLILLPAEDCDRYLKLEEGKRVKNINDIKDKRRFDHKGQ